MIKQFEVGPVTLRVKNLQEVTAFYENALGLRIREQQTGRVVLGTAVRDLVILEAAPEAKVLGSSGTGLFHLAILVPDREDLGAWLRHFQTQPEAYQQLFEGPGDHGVSEALYLHDPEGNGIEIYADRPRDQWPRDGKSNIQMYTLGIDLRKLLNDAVSREWNGMPEASVMGHVHLKVSDLKASHRFYVDQLGMDLILNFGDGAKFISKNGYHHHIGMNTWNSLGSQPQDSATLGLAGCEFHVGLNLEGRAIAEVVRTLAIQLEASGIVIDELSEDSIRFLDPDQIPITFKAVAA